MARAQKAGPAILTGHLAEHLDHLAFRARCSHTGLGAAVVTAKYERGQRSWDCIAGNPDEWHHLQVIGVEMGPFAGLSPEVIEDGIERFGASLRAHDSLRQLINFSPLHIDWQGTVGD